MEPTCSPIKEKHASIRISLVLVAIAIASCPFWGMFLFGRYKLYSARESTRALWKLHEADYLAIITKITQSSKEDPGSVRRLEISDKFDITSLKEGPYLPTVPRGQLDGRYLEYYYDRSDRLIVRILSKDLGSPLGSFWILHIAPPDDATAVLFGHSEKIAPQWWIIQAP